MFLIILALRLGPKYRNWAERASKRRFLQGLIFAPLMLLTIALLSLPTDAWDHSLEARFGLSVQSWAAWFSDWVTAQILTLILGTLLIVILYATIRRSARRWWLYFWMACIPILLALFFIQPLVVDPLFYTFTPLQQHNPQLLAQMQDIIHHAGVDIPPPRIFEVNASSKTTSINAYVTGFGASKRAVVYDTTISQLTPPEVLFVFGHEMGHYVLFHIPKEMAIYLTLLLVLIYLGYRLAHWMLAHWGQRWEIRSLEDWASLPLLFFILTALTFLATPAFNAISRHFEHEADRYGVEVIHGIVPNAQQAAARGFERSGELDLADPNPSAFMKFWMFDHPTRPERIHFVANYDPWSKDESPRYVH
jgi:Zn-dependent protease with chaperone function